MRKETENKRDYSTYLKKYERIDDFCGRFIHLTKKEGCIDIRVVFKGEITKIPKEEPIHIIHDRIANECNKMRRQLCNLLIKFIWDFCYKNSDVILYPIGYHILSSAIATESDATWFGGEGTNNRYNVVSFTSTLWSSYNYPVDEESLKEDISEIICKFLDYIVNEHGYLYETGE